MRRFLTALLLALPFLALAQEVAPKLALELDAQEFAVGEAITGTAVIEFMPGLHAYQNPPTDPSWMIPLVVSGDEVTNVDYPKGIWTTAAGTEADYYMHTTRIPVVFSGFAAPGEYTLTVTFSYQQCDEGACYMPTSGTASASVTIKAQVVKQDPPKEQPTEQPTPPKEEPTTDDDETDEQAVDDLDLEINPKPIVTVTGPKGTLGAGKAYAATLTVTFGEGLHAYQNPPTDPERQIPLSISGPSFLNAEYPEGRMTIAAGTEAAYYEGRVEIPVVFTAPDEPGTHTIELTIDYQQCDEAVCFMPDQVLVSFDVEVVEGEGTEPTLDFSELGDEEKDYGSGLEGFVTRILTEEIWALIIPTALFIGLLLCLTPCVFPMIPITVSFFSSQSTDNKGSRMMLGGLYALGIAVTYGVAGGMVARAGDMVGELFTRPWFMISLAALLIALALSMFGLYEIRLPAVLQRNLKGRSGPVGAVIMGLLMGFAAAPCAGALVGAVAAKVADVGSVPVGIGLFGLIGLGMGLPFMALAAVSTSAGKFMRSGGWLTTVKALIGFIVLYFAFDYLFKGFGMKAEELRTYIAWIVVYAGFAGYLFFFDKSDVSKAVGRIKGVAGLAIGVLVGMSFAGYTELKHKIEYEKLLAESGIVSDGQVSNDGIDWIAYNDESFAEAVASGKPIMIDGTANWCAQCHEIEKNVFNTPEGLVALSSVYLLRIDLSTGVDPAYKKMTEERFNIVGLPHIVFYEPGGENEFTVKSIGSVEELKTLLKRAGADL